MTVKEDDTQNGFESQDAEDQARREMRALVQGKPVEASTTNEPEETETTTAEATSAPAVEQPASTENPDPLSYIPEEHRGKYASKLQELEAQVRAAQKRYDSDIGRINAYQSKYEEARREAEALQAKLAASQKTPPKPLRDLSERFRERAEVDDIFVDDLEEFRSKIREETLAEADARLNARLAPFEQRQQLEAQRHQEEAVETFNRTLDEKYPNWREIVYAHDDNGKVRVNKDGQPEFSQQWAHFLRDQPANLRNAYMNVGSAEEAIRAIEDHDQWGIKNGYFTQSDESTTIPNADKIQEKRQADLKKSPPNKASNVPLQVRQTEDLNNPEDVNRLRAKFRKAIREGDTSVLRNTR